MKKKITALLAAALMLTACTAAIEKPTDTAEVTANTAASQNKKNTETTPVETANAAETKPAEAFTEETVSDGEMSLEEKVGQILLARFPESGAAETMEKYRRYFGRFVLN